jgi:hypothetical protein
MPQSGSTRATGRVFFLFLLSASTSNLWNNIYNQATTIRCCTGPAIKKHKRLPTRTVQITFWYLLDRSLSRGGAHSATQMRLRHSAAAGRFFNCATGFLTLAVRFLHAAVRSADVEPRSPWYLRRLAPLVGGIMVMGGAR